MYFNEASEYTVQQKNQSHFIILKDGVPTYNIVKKQSNWVCDCTAFKYRHQCKHLSLIKNLLPKRHPRSEITQAIKTLIPALKRITPRVEVVGSYRRGKSDSKDIDILIDCSASEFQKVINICRSLGNYTETITGPALIRGDLDGIPLDINRLAENMNYYLALEYRTGPMEHNVAMRRLAISKNGHLSENELIVEGKNIRVSSERDIYDALGVEYQDPTKRSENLKLITPKNVSYYEAFYGSKNLGPAPSMAIAKNQVKQIRAIARNLYNPSSKLMQRLEEIFTEIQPSESLVSTNFNFTARITCKDIKNTPDRYSQYDIIYNGKSIPKESMTVEITPHVKLNGKGVKNNFKVTWKGKDYKLIDLFQYIFTHCINKYVEQTPKVKPYTSALQVSVDALQQKLIVNTIAYPVESVKS